jgi:hypothetical protein
MAHWDSRSDYKKRSSKTTIIYNKNVESGVSYMSYIEDIELSSNITTQINLEGNITTTINAESSFKVLVELSSLITNQLDLISIVELEDV